MSFCQMIELLQRRNKGKIVFVNAGSFYIAVGKDAVLLNQLLNLKVTCVKQEICKVGFPINALEKYTEILSQKDYSYIVYYFDNQKEELEVKISMYKMLNKIMYISKISEKKECLNIINQIDAELNTQRIFLRIMQKNKWIDEKKFKVAMELIYEIGKIVGGLVKYYAKNN